MLGAKTVRDLFFEARGVVQGRAPTVTRGALVERANLIPGAPDGLDTRHLDAIERGRRPPVGPHLRYFAAAAGIPLFDILAADPILYWPEVQAPGSEVDPRKAKEAAFLDLCGRWGLRVTSRIGSRFVVEVE